MRELANKEKKMEEMFLEKEKELLQAFSKELAEKLAQKDEEIAKCQAEVDKFKLKNVSWVEQEASLRLRIDTLEKENEKLMQQYCSLQESFVQAIAQPSKVWRQFSSHTVRVHVATIVATSAKTSAITIHAHLDLMLPCNGRNSSHSTPTHRDVDIHARLQRYIPYHFGIRYCIFTK